MHTPPTATAFVSESFFLSRGRLRPAYQNILHDVMPGPLFNDFSRTAQFDQSIPSWNSFPSRTKTVWFLSDQSSKLVNVGRCQTNYFPARKTNVTCNSFPGKLSTSLAEAASCDDGHSSSKSLSLSIFFNDEDIQPVWVLMSHLTNVSLTFEVVLLDLNRIGGYPRSLGPKKRIQSGVCDGETYNADSPQSSSCTCVRAISPTYKTTENG